MAELTGRRGNLLVLDGEGRVLQAAVTRGSQGRQHPRGGVYQPLSPRTPSESMAQEGRALAPSRPDLAERLEGGFCEAKEDGADAAAPALGMGFDGPRGRLGVGLAVVEGVEVEGDVLVLGVLVEEVCPVDHLELEVGVLEVAVFGEAFANGLLPPVGEDALVRLVGETMDANDNGSHYTPPFQAMPYCSRISRG